MNPALPQRVLAWYGDDFTGSTDVLAALAARGLPSVLFLEQPGEEFLARFADYRAFGLAGSSRSQSPEWMDRHLPSAFSWLARFEAAICHYKVCSTFDSSPEVGNIGRALEIGQRVFDASWVPVVVGVPALGRYTVFGNLFAGAGDGIHRIDRHPTMSRHPVTPMLEADLRLHLGRQTSRRIELLHVLELSQPDVDELLDAKLAGGPDAVLMDNVDELSQLRVGRLLWSPRFRQRFVVGSSSVEYALTAYWLDQGLLGTSSASWSAAVADRLVVLSGSCSPVTERQIRCAGQNGFGLVRLDAAALASGDGRGASSEVAVESAVNALREGRSVVLYSASGPDDRLASGNSQEFRHSLGRQSGRILRAVLDRSGARRIVIAGGDTSSHAVEQLGIQALTFVYPLEPGVPMCRAWSQEPARDGIEIVLKGGQMGRDKFFVTALECGV